VAASNSTAQEVLTMIQSMVRQEAEEARLSGPDRQPVMLLLGGGMAAGKSTVRELIGQSAFWSKARLKQCMI
jgi:hypothetical protein